MQTPETAQLAAETTAERERLATLFDDFGSAQWATPSLCAGWRVREVVAHVTMPYRISPVRFFAGLARARFSFNRFADRAARATTRAMSDDDLRAVYRENIRNPWQPPGGGAVGALSHDVIHGLDITEPLDLPAPPPSRIALVLASAGPRNISYFGVDLAGTRLVATDADLTIGGDGKNGDGTPVQLPAKEILLVVTGRRKLADIPEAHA